MRASPSMIPAEMAATGWRMGSLLILPAFCSRRTASASAT